MHFLHFGGKLSFSVFFTGKCVILVLAENYVFPVLAGKGVFPVLRENVFFAVLAETCVFVFFPGK